MTRTLIIGDIHACWDELQDLFAKVGLTADDVVVSVGDVVDRGHAPTEVVRWFRSRPNAVVVSGNHERKHVRNVLSASQEITRVQMADAYADSVAWMATLPYSWEGAGVAVVHAACIPGVPLAETPDDILSGTTSGEERLLKRLSGRWWHELYDGPTPIVFGHHVVEQPLVRDGKVYGIDTGCCHGGALTALVLPSFELVSVPARADHWKATRSRFAVEAVRRQDWGGMAFEQIERRARQRGEADPETTAWYERLRAWADGLRATIPRLTEAAETEIQRLRDQHGDGFAHAAASHPAGNVLHRLANGRLSRERLGCATPNEVIRLADALGVPIDVRSPPNA